MIPTEFLWFEEAVWFVWGGGILAVLLAAVALVTRRLPWRRALCLMMAVFSLGMGALVLTIGIRNCDSFSGSECYRWASSPATAGAGLLVLVGATLALWAVLLPGPPKRAGLLLLAAGVLTLPGSLAGMLPLILTFAGSPAPKALLVLELTFSLFILAPLLLLFQSPARLLMALLPPATFLVLGRRWFRHRRT